jgi:hypothetical protein
MKRSLFIAFFLFASNCYSAELQNCLAWYMQVNSEPPRISNRLQGQGDGTLLFDSPIDGPCSLFGSGLVYLRAELGLVKEFKLMVFSRELNLILFLDSLDRLALNKQYQKDNAAFFYPVSIPTITSQLGYSIIKTGYGFQEVIFYGGSPNEN